MTQALLDASWAALKGAGHTKGASWTPAGGTALPEDVIWSAAGEIVLNDVSTIDRIVRYRTNRWPGLREGMTVTIEGAAYRVREVLTLGDGLTAAASLAKL